MKPNTLTTTKVVFSFVVGMTMLSSSAALAANACREILSKPHVFDNMAHTGLKPLNLETALAENYASDSVTAYRDVKALKAAHPSFGRDSQLNKALLEVMNDESLSTFHLTIQRLTAGLQEKYTSGQLSATATSAQIRAAAKEILFEDLKKIMPDAMAEQKSSVILTKNQNKDSMLQALGRLSHQESLEAWVGSDIHNINSDSIVGRYLAKMRAQGHAVQTFIGHFPKAPGYGGGHGPDKLFIAMDATSKPVLDEVIGLNPNLYFHPFTSQQGTLYMNFLGKHVLYAHFGPDQRPTAPNAVIMPAIVVSSVEGSNLKNTFDLGTMSGTYNGRSKYIWKFAQRNEDGTTTPYAPAGGYQCCTHWNGEIPFGEDYVDEYKVAGPNNSPGQNVPPTAGPVGTFNSYEGTPVGKETRMDRLSHIVFTQGKGRKQLWEIVGDRNAGALGRGEWANPSFTAYALLTRTNQDRVPVVFVNTANATEPLTQEAINALTSNMGGY